MQEQLIAKKDEQISQIQATVQTSVKKSVEKEIKSYSEVVGNCALSSNNSKLPSSSDLRKTVQEVVDHEDRCRNFMIFGFKDQETEETQQAVGKVLDAVGEKPRIMEAKRLGRFVAGSCRPIQVTVGASSTASQIIRKGKVLRNSAEFKDVYISPDRTLAEREERKKYIENRKKEKQDLQQGSEVVRELRGRTVIATK